MNGVTMKATDLDQDYELEFNQGHFTDEAKGLWVELISGRLPNPVFDKMTTEQKDTFKELLEVDTKCRDILQNYYKEWEELRSKFQNEIKIVIDARKEILHNDKSGEPVLLPEGLADETTENMPVGTPMLPGFWFTTLKQHQMLNDLIEPQDEAALRFLVNIEVTYDNNEQMLQDGIVYHSYTLNFYFAPNPFFTNTCLSKKFICKKSHIGSCMWNDLGEDVLVAGIGTDIQWNPDKCLLTENKQRRQRNKKTGETRVIYDKLPQNSFFNFFLSHLVPSEAAVSKLCKSELEDLDCIMESEYECGMVIRDKIIPNALKWYVGLGHDSDFEETSYSYEYGDQT